MMLFLLMCITSMGQNNLSVGKLTGGQGKDVLIPISLENTDEVVALQFDLQLPFDRSSALFLTIGRMAAAGQTAAPPPRRCSQGWGWVSATSLP